MKFTFLMAFEMRIIEKLSKQMNVSGLVMELLKHDAPVFTVEL